MQAAVSNRSAGEKRRVRLRKAGLREDQDRTEGHVSLFRSQMTSSKTDRRLSGFSNERIRKIRGAHGERLIRNSRSETVAARNRRLVIDRHPDQFG
jgi:hypothetical protein